MNFVVYSHGFLPANDAEGFCTARFVNALAGQGHHVDVVTMNWPQQVEDDVVNELLANKITVHRVERRDGKRPIWARLRYLSRDWSAANISSSVAVVRSVLKKRRNPILVSRGNPEASHIVGFLSRDLALKWVVHFSDPYPWFGPPWVERIGRWWGRRLISSADYCSITCEEVKRFFKENYGNVYRKNEAKFIVTTHIGDPLLGGRRALTHDSTVYTIAHCGFLSTERGLDAVLSELPMAAIEKKIRFLQLGMVSERDVKRIRTAPNFFESKLGLHTREVTDVFQVADINLVSDLKTHLPYIPFLPSKFVYALFTDTPILVYTMKNSCMHRYSIEYPEAGVWFADVNEPGSLGSAVERIYKERKAMTIDRSRIRKCFLSQTVAEKFAKDIQVL